MNWRTVCGICAGIVLGAGVLPCEAATVLTTPATIINGTDQIVCFITNAGDKTAKISVQLKTMDGGVATEANLSCGSELTPGASCFKTYGAGVDGSCVFSGTGKLRAALEIYGQSDSGPFVRSIVPATK